MLETKHSHSPASLVWSNNKTFNTDCKSIYSPYFYLHTIVFFAPIVYTILCHLKMEYAWLTIYANFTRSKRHFLPVLLQEIDSYLLSKVKGIVKIFQTTYSSTNVLCIKPSILMTKSTWMKRLGRGEFLRWKWIIKKVIFAQWNIRPSSLVKSFAPSWIRSDSFV